MKKYTIFLLLFACIFLYSCEKTTKIVITPENAGDVVVINSDNNELSDFFDAVPNTYELESVNDTLQLEISFIVNKDVKEYLRGEFESFVLVPMNAENNVIGNITFNACNGKEMHDMLFNSAKGTNVTVKFQYVLVNDEERDIIMKELCFCKVELNLEDMAFEEFADEPESDEDSYDHVMDMYIQAVIDGDEEIIMATAENIAESQMEGLLTPEQEKRWQNIDAEINQKKAAK